MKRTIILWLLVGFSTVCIAQKKMQAHKLSKEEMSRMTPEQRLVHETQRKSGKNHRVGNKKKARIQKKQSRKSERIRPPKRNT